MILLWNHPQYTAFKSTVYISDYAIISINKSNANISYCSFPSEDVAIETQPVF